VKVGPQNKYILMPTIDDDILPDEPLKLLQQGTYNQVPLLIGSTHDEFEFFISDTSKIKRCQHYDQYINAQFGNKANDVVKTYPCNNDENARDVAVQAAGDFYFTCPSRRAGRFAAAAPNAKPVYQYLYSNPVDPNPFNPPGFRNASHLADIPFIFATFLETGIILGQLPPWAERSVPSDQMEQYWLEFAKNPNNPGWGTWHPYDPTKDNFLTFGPLQISQQTNRKSGKCDFWDQWPTPF
jgi:para-nitrobenzyl esterase